jgi:MFS family permease
MTTSVAVPAEARTPMAAQLALALAIAFVGLVAVLHAVRADLVPRAHVLSEYALGPAGWLMALAFFALAASFAALLVALWTSLPGWRGVLGRAALVIAALGAAMGGLFPMDPIGTPPEQASVSAQLHNLAFMLGGPGALAAITFVNSSLARQPAWRGARRMLLITSALAWLAMVVFSVAVSMLMGDPQGGDRAIGVWNRLLVLSWVVWVICLSMNKRR